MRKPAPTPGRTAAARRRQPYAADAAVPTPPRWLTELVAEIEASDVPPVTTPETFRRAVRLARAIDADPDLPPGRVAVFLREFDRLLAERIEHLQERADTAVIWRLRARAAGF